MLLRSWTTVDRVIKLSTAGAEYCLFETRLVATVAFGTFRTQKAGVLVAVDRALLAATRAEERRASIVLYELAICEIGSGRLLTPALRELDGDSGEGASGQVVEFLCHAG
jgi:hypothetical protein